MDEIRDTIESIEESAAFCHDRVTSLKLELERLVDSLEVLSIMLQEDE